MNSNAPEREATALRVLQSNQSETYAPETAEANLFKNIRLQRTGAAIAYNASCLKCECVEKEMVRVGPLYFCLSCYYQEFETRDPSREEREQYLYWLNIYKQQ